MLAFFLGETNDNSYTICTDKMSRKCYFIYHDIIIMVTSCKTVRFLIITKTTIMQYNNICISAGDAELGQ